MDLHGFVLQGPDHKAKQDEHENIVFYRNRETAQKQAAEATNEQLEVGPARLVYEPLPFDENGPDRPLGKSRPQPNFAGGTNIPRTHLAKQIEQSQNRKPEKKK